MITDVAGNQRQSAVVPVIVDSTGPSVTLNDPGAVLAGPRQSHDDHRRRRRTRGVRHQPGRRGQLDAARRGHDARRSARPSTRPPSRDGLYDLRAIGYDTFGNPSAPSLRPGVRFDNTAPRLVSSSPQDGSVSTAANQIVLTANEPAARHGRHARRRPRAGADRLRLDPDLRHRVAHGGAARALGPARGRNRHERALPRRRHDREHARRRPPAGRVERVADPDLRRSRPPGRSRPSRCRRPPGPRRRRRRTSSSCASIRRRRWRRSRRASRPAAS